MNGARDQVTRLMALVPYLQSRGGVPLVQVAEDFGVPTKQILRDLRVLWMCGLPGLLPGDYIDIDFEAIEDDPEGLVRIDNADYLARPIRLTSSEAAALIVALRALREGSQDASREVVDRVLAKLEDAAATGGAALEVQLAEDEADLARLRSALDEVIAANRQVRLRYYVPTRDESTDRIVDPIAVLRAKGNDYLDAWCHLAEGRRLFRLSRIEDLEPLSTPRERPDVEPRDLPPGIFEPDPDDTVVEVRLAPDLRWFVDYYPVTRVSEAGDGRLDAELRVGDPMWLLRLVLRLAPGLEVLSPPDLRERAVATAAATRELYDA